MFVKAGVLVAGYLFCARSAAQRWVPRGVNIPTRETWASHSNTMEFWRAMKLPDLDHLSCSHAHRDRENRSAGANKINY